MKYNLKKKIEAFNFARLLNYLLTYPPITCYIYIYIYIERERERERESE